MKKIVKLRKQGNCLVITIPRDLLEDLKWAENDQILIESQPQNADSMFKGPKFIKAGKID
ncbi:MAG: AbrB/MazE/SpoVT family DNA-binding domain-containing protein [Candidatus Bathyarchaeia archaeon]